jgi:antitoxin VapB
MVGVIRVQAKDGAARNHAEKYILHIPTKEAALMQATAKLFTSGGSQAVRLPVEFRLPGAEVFIRRNPRTGEVVLSPKPASWQEFFDLADRAGIPDDFMDDRLDMPAQERNLF